MTIQSRNASLISFYNLSKIPTTTNFKIMTKTENKKRILFVCLGNICRSPAAEGIFRKLVKDRGLEDDYIIDSAGTAGYHSGDLPDKRMRHHGALRGYTFDSVSRRLVSDDFLRFDYILVMDDSNYDNAIDMAPDLESRSKVHRMVDFSQLSDHDHVPDPYYGGDAGFQLVIDILEDACEGLLGKLEEE